MRIDRRNALILGMSLTCGFVTKALPAQTQKKPTRKGRETYSLDGDTWRFLTDTDDKGEANGWTKTIPAAAQTARVPGLSLPRSEKAVWFWREFDTPTGMLQNDGIVRLQFGAVSENADVWLNGTLLGAHIGGAVPFEFNITTALQKRGENLLVVRAIGAGIQQSVQLVAHDEAYIADIFPQPNHAGNLSVPITLVNTSVKSGDAALLAEIFPANQAKNSIHKSWQYLHLSPGRNITTVLLNVPPKSLKAWTPERPALYTLGLRFEQADDLLDKTDVLFGFRDFGFQNGAITLNNTPLTLKSTQNPLAMELARPMTEEARQRAIRTLRGLQTGGTNLIYVEAPAPALLDCADEAGIFVVVGPRSQQPLPVAFEELRALMVRDRAHPSIIAWNLGERDRPGILLCRELDPTRFLLVGTGDKARLWLPNQDAPAKVAPPAGFLPP